MQKGEKLDWDASAGVLENAQRVLPPLVRDYFKHGRALMAEKWSVAAFHRFRLETKRLRYTLELFRPCYGPRLERSLAGLRTLQDYLGAINDCSGMRELVAAVLSPRSVHRKRIEALLAVRLRRVTAQLRKHWREEFDRAGEEDRWVKYLSGAGPGRAV